MDVAARLEKAFQRNFECGREVGAAVSVWKDNREIASFHQGFRDAARRDPWTADTIVLVWSATKGPAAACVLRALEISGVPADSPVAKVWPEFAASGKDRITFLEILSHAAGLCAMRNPEVSVFDHPAVVASLAAQAPFAEVVGRPAYGPRTSGFLFDEIVRRLCGVPSLGEFWRQEFAAPLGLDFWIGLPESEGHRTAAMLAPRSLGTPDDPFLQAFADPKSLTRQAFAGPSGLSSPSAMNQPAARSAGLASMGGIGSASALAKFYAHLATAPPHLATQVRNAGLDAVLRHSAAFSAGFLLDPLKADGTKERSTMGPSLTAFGHPGAGGSLAFADPENRLGFAYVMNQMEPGVLPNDRAIQLVRAVYDSNSA